MYILRLWIALPVARTDSQKKEMYGNRYSHYKAQYSGTEPVQMNGTQQFNSGYDSSSRVGNAINEVFRALGKVCYVIFRIVLIMIGVSFVLTGFLSILSYVLIFIFKFPGLSPQMYQESIWSIFRLSELYCKSCYCSMDYYFRQYCIHITYAGIDLLGCKNDILVQGKRRYREPYSSGCMGYVNCGTLL